MFNVSASKRAIHALIPYYRLALPSVAALLILETLEPFVRRVVTILVLLSAFRAFIGANEVRDSSAGFLDIATPVLLGVLAYLVIPPFLNALIVLFRKRLRQAVPRRKILALAQGSGVDEHSMTSLVSTHRRILHYVLAAPFVYLMLFLVLSYALWSYLVAEALFWLLTLALGATLGERHWFARNGSLIEIASYIAFGAYIAITALFLFHWPVYVSIEHVILFALIPRVQFASMRRAAQALAKPDHRKARHA